MGDICRIVHKYTHTSKMGLLRPVGIALTLASLLVVSASYAPVSPPSCGIHDPAPNATKQVTIQYVYNVSRTIQNDIMNQGWCFKLIEQRMIGPLQISRDLMKHGDALLNHFDQLKNDTLARENYAKKLKNGFVEGFESCAEGSCVAAELCAEIADYGDSSDSWSNIRDQIEDNCLKEAWRFQEIIMYNNVDACEFSFVPVSYAKS